MSPSRLQSAAPVSDDHAEYALPTQKTLVGLAFFIVAHYKAAVTQWIGVLIFSAIFIGGAVLVLNYTAPIFTDLKETSHNLREAVNDLQELRNLLRADVRKNTP